MHNRSSLQQRREHLRRIVKFVKPKLRIEVSLCHEARSVEALLSLVFGRADIPALS